MKQKLVALAGAAMGLAVVAANGQTHPTYGGWGVDLSSMDRSVKPGDNFFLFVNGTWLKTATIPADRTSTGSFQDLQILSEQRMKAIVGELESRPANQLDAEAKQLRDLYDAYVDTSAIDAAGLKPARRDLMSFAHIKSLDGVAAAMGAPDSGTDSLFADRVVADPKNSNAYVITLVQAGLGLPERDYYLRDDKALAATRDAYRKYLTDMLTLAGEKDADKRAAQVFDLETALAKVEWPAADRRDADKTYNPITLSALEKVAPGFPWRAYLKAQGVTPTGPNGERTLIVRENTAFPEMAKIFAATPVSVWRDWLTLHYLHNMSAYLPSRLRRHGFRVLRQGSGRARAQAPPRHPRRSPSRCAARPPAGQDLCREVLPAGIQGQGRSPGRPTCSRHTTPTSALFHG